MKTEHIVKQCLRNDKRAQKALFDLYAGKMMALCRRYARTQEEAEDFLQEGFIRLFKFLGTYDGKGSFDGWVRRIFVNTAIRHYHRHKKHNQNHEISHDLNGHERNDAISHLGEQELIALINRMPEGYRLVFNMYIVEGFSHREIGEMLSIGESTSRSQLAKARKWLQQKIRKTQKVVL